MSELKNNDNVIIEHNKQLTPGTVVRKHASPRSYIVETLAGQRLRRNRKHLKPTKATFRPTETMNISEPFSFKTSCNRNTDQLFETSANLEPNNNPPKQQNQTTTTETKSADITTTKSGRSVKLPAKLKDYVCNSINNLEIYV